MSPERNVDIRHVSRENIRRDPPRLIFAEQLGRRAPPQLILEVDVRACPLWSRAFLRYSAMYTL
jgi:hypothetical protein